MVVSVLTEQRPFVVSHRSLRLPPAPVRVSHQVKPHEKNSKPYKMVTDSDSAFRILWYESVFDLREKIHKRNTRSRGNQNPLTLIWVTPLLVLALSMVHLNST